MQNLKITEYEFGRLEYRYIFQVVCINTGNRYTYLTKNSAYNKMENIKKALEFNKSIERVEFNDLDCRPDKIITECGTVYELIVVTIDY